MKIKFSLFIFLLFGILFRVHAQDEKQKPDAKYPFYRTFQNEFTTPVPEGAKVSLVLPARIKIGDLVKGEFIISNDSKEPFEVSTGGDYRGSGIPLRLRVRVTDAKGNILPDSSIGLMDFGGFSGSDKVEPGKTYTIECPLEGYITFPEAGVYKIEAWHDLGWKEDEARPHPIARTSVEVEMPTTKEAEVLVKELCESRKNDSEWQLNKLQHPIFLPALIAEASSGKAIAVIGIGNIPTLKAIEALLSLLRHTSTEVVEAAAEKIWWRLPNLSIASVHDKKSNLKQSHRAILLETWDPKLREQLLASARILLKSKEIKLVGLGARLIEAQGDDSAALPLLEALQNALDLPWVNRSGKNANVLDPAPPINGLLKAIDALRARGWRTNGTGGPAVVLAYFRQIADIKMPRPNEDKWVETVFAFIDANPPVLRENAIEIIPKPITDKFALKLRKALKDEDWAVVIAACNAVRDSGRKEFIPDLTHIILNIRETFVLNAAHLAANSLDARTELWNAWCEVITDEKFMVDAITHLAQGTIDLPEFSRIGGNSNFTSDQRKAMRDAWCVFLEKNHADLSLGKRVSMNDSSINLTLTGSNFGGHIQAISIQLKDGSSWPIIDPVNNKK